MPSSSDRTRVGRTLTSEEVLSLPWRAETSNSRSRRKTSVLRPMISAPTARIDDNLGRGTDGSNPLPSSGESTNHRFRRRFHLAVPMVGVAADVHMGVLARIWLCGKEPGAMWRGCAAPIPTASRHGPKRMRRTSQRKEKVGCTQAGLAAARRAGRTGGRPLKLTQTTLRQPRRCWPTPTSALCKSHTVSVFSPATLYRYIPAARTANIPDV